MYRHGDILLLAAAEPSADREWTPEPAAVLAHGEATGHAHVLRGNVLMSTAGGRTLLRVLETALLTHEEHATIQVPPGLYEVRRQRVYTPRAPVRVRD